MTEPSFAVSPPAAGAVPAAVLHYATSLVYEAVQAVLNGSQPRSTTRLLSPPEALCALAGSGSSTESDDVLGMPAAEGRLVLVQAESVAVADRVLAMLAGMRRTVVARVGAVEVLVLVAGVPRPSGVDSALRHAENVLSVLRRSECRGWHGAVGSRLTGAADIEPSFRDVRDAVAIAVRGNVERVLLDECWADVTAARLRLALAHCRTVASPVDRLLAYDCEHGTEFGRTVGEWLAVGCDTSRAAAGLAIHPNTLRYRLGRAQSLVGIDLDDPKQRLVLQLSSTSVRKDTA